ncbi:MAG TPA: hypothetical protein VFS95_04820 [Telluria sp.]|nr:hypothetical protein [Telluria sp.]
MKIKIQPMAAAALTLALSLFANVGNAASVWEGEFHSPYELSDNNMVDWVFTSKCNAKDECTITSAFMKDGKIVKQSSWNALGPKTAFKFDPVMTRELRLSAQMVSEMAEPPTGPPHYNAAIYPQIGSPDRVLECRGGATLPAWICRLDRPLIDTGDRRLSEWVLLLPDMSSGSGCPGGGSVCPATLRKK